MNDLRYYVVPLTTPLGMTGFVLGGGWVWLGEDVAVGGVRTC